MSDLTVCPKRQKAGFRILFLTELWERFGFYTVASILVLYLSKSLHYSDTQAYTMFAVFTALMYITPMLGGFLADTKIGFQRTLILGVILLLFGYTFLAIPGQQFMLVGLSFIIVGAGFFKSMPYALLGRLYNSPKQNIDTHFTLYYLSINIGGIPALLCAGYISQKFGWHTAFGIAAAGLLLATVTFICYRSYFHRIGNRADFKPLTTRKTSLVFMITILTIIASYFLLSHTTLTSIVTIVATVVVFSYVFWISKKFSTDERKRLLGASILILFGTVFFIFYYQQPMSMVLFIDRHVTHHIFGIYLPSSAFWMFNPIWILSIGPILSYGYSKLGKHDPSVATKFAIGIIIMSFGYFILMIAAHHANMNARVSPWWAIFSYGFQGCGELLVNALGTAMIAKIVPKSITGIMMGAWFLTSAGGSLLAGKFADLTTVPKGVTDPFTSLQIYGHSFAIFGSVCLATGLIALLLAPVVKRLINEKNVSQEQSSVEALRI